MAKLTYGGKARARRIGAEAALAGFLPGHAVVIAVVAGVAPVGADGGEQFQRPEFYGLDEADVAVEAVAAAEYVPGPADMEHAVRREQAQFHPGLGGRGTVLKPAQPPVGGFGSLERGAVVSGEGGKLQVGQVDDLDARRIPPDEEPFPLIGDHGERQPVRARSPCRGSCSRCRPRRG